MILVGIITIIANNSFALNSSSYLIANTAITLFDYDKAYSEYKGSDSSELSNLELNNKLLVLINLNLYFEAFEVAKKILKIDIKNQEAWSVYLAYSKSKKNIIPFKEYGDLVDDPEMNLLSFIFFEENGKIKNNISTVRSLFELVQASVKNNKNDDNYKFLLFYLSLINVMDPNFYESYYFSAQIYTKLKNYNKAEYYYKKINSKNYLFVDSQKNIAINKSKINQFPQGQKILINLINDNKDNIDLLIALADLYRIEKKYNEAINYYTKIIAQTDNLYLEYWKIFYLRGICYEKFDNWNLAEKDFLYSLKMKPDSPDVLNYLAYGWLERDQKLGDAMKMLTKAYQSNPDSYYILDSLAWAYFKKKQFQKALELMEEVIIKAPGEAVSLDHLGDIYFAVKRKREAVYLWKQALDFADPKALFIDLVKKKIKKYD